jgi:hypothetical protein
MLDETAPAMIGSEDVGRSRFKNIFLKRCGV